MIITLLPVWINGQNHKTFVKNLQANLNAVAAKLGIFRFREYRIILDFKEHILRVPLITEKGSKQLLCPAGLLPRRRYPLAVYLCAVSIYAAGGLSMRKVAVLTRKMFGLDQFSHSTISRSRKKLLSLLASTVHPLDADDSPCSNKTYARSLLQCLRELLQDIPQDPFFYTEKIALHFFRTFKVFLL